MLVEVLNRSSLEDRVAELEQFIGNTPLFPIRNFDLKPGVEIYAKLEWQQMGSSVKARPAFNIIKQAILNGDLTEGKVLLDASSGNTGVAYGAIGAALGIPVALCLPENASVQKQSALKFFGVEVVYTSRFEGTDGAQEKAAELAAQYPDRYFYADQYANDNNWKAHYMTTGLEIYEQTAGEITHFITGLGTTGTFTGTSRRLKELNPEVEIIAIQPDSALHGMEGWKHMETAKNPLFYDANLADRNVEMDTETAYRMVQEVAGKEGLILSPSSAANLAGALRLAQEIEQGTIVTVFPDHGSNYPEVLSELIQP